jgi:phenylacetate-coenzyme A ligase PaaK-like adenylate-forming protein
MILEGLTAIAAKGLHQQRRKHGALTIERLLAHSIDTVPYYRNLNLKPNIELFPLIGRRILNESAASFRSTSYKESDVYAITTSGSTGVPLSVFRDLASLYHETCDTWRQYFERLSDLSCPRSFRTSVFVINDNPSHNDILAINPALTYSLQRLLVLGKSPTRDLAVADILSSRNVALLNGRPRALLRLAEVSEESGLSIRPKAVVTAGDNLYDNDRHLISRAFNAPVFNAYSSTEGGTVALECEPGGPMHVFSDNVYCEILDVNDKISNSGYGQLVVTNLQNYAMCFPRYLSGDMVELSVGKCTCGHIGQLLQRIDGRVSVYFTVGGSRFNPSILNAVFEAYPLKQFQLTQLDARSFKLLLVPKCTEDERAEIAELIKLRLRERLGDAVIELRFVDRIGTQGQKVQRYVVDVHRSSV